jgi:hypothetical protein
MEDELGALDLARNAVVLFNSLYIDPPVKQLASDGFPVTDELLARLSPLQYDHIDFLGRYAFTRPAVPERCPLRDRTQTTSRTTAMAGEAGRKAEWAARYSRHG